MAQPTVTDRPATWAGTSAPILYKITSTNYANAGYRLEVEIWDSTAAAKIADAKYYANSAGLITVDVSSFLKANMSLENDSDLTSGTVYTDTNWLKYYIKYQEVWTASSETQVNDVANLRYAIYGGLQLGVINSFNPDYFDVTFNFLMLSGSPKAVLNHPFTFSHISHVGSYLRVERFLNGSSLDVTDTVISNEGIIRGKHTETGTADQVELSIVAKSITLGSLSTFTNQGTGTNWTTGSNPSFNITGVFATTKKLSAAFAGIVGVTYDFNYNIDLTVGSDLEDVYICLLDASYNIIVSTGINQFGTGNYTGTASLTPTETSVYIGVYANLADSGIGSVQGDINSLTHTPVETIISEVKTLTIEEDCNTVMLQWKNSLGGDECFPFQVNQEYTWHYSDRKAKRLTLYADNLTLSQWEAIQGLNTIGELYKTPITEMTTSINRTMATIGQSVYVLNSDGSKTGVNVIGSPNTTNTKQKKHSAFVTIEYPELFLQ